MVRSSPHCFFYISAKFIQITLRVAKVCNIFIHFSIIIIYLIIFCLLLHRYFTLRVVLSTQIDGRSMLRKIQSLTCTSKSVEVRHKIYINDTFSLYVIFIGKNLDESDSFINGHIKRHCNISTCRSNSYLQVLFSFQTERERDHH